jgi:hypothetical protein
MADDGAWITRTINELEDRIAELKGEVAELDKDARRYRYFRANQYWQRTNEFDLIGLTFSRDNGFTSPIWLDRKIDQCLAGEAKHGTE